MATYTATIFANAPKAVHAGVNSVSGQFNLGTQAATVGDILYLAKIPHGATIVDVVEDHTNGQGAFAVSIGLASGGPGGSATFSCFIANGAVNTVNRRNVAGVPLTVSVSDNDAGRYGVLAAKLESGSLTTNTLINFSVLYRTDQT